MSFELEKLPYSYDALEPYIDAETMEIHYTKHYAGYTNNLNAAIAGTDLENKTIEEILVDGFDITAVRNNGGGYYNHSLFWRLLSPDGGQPSGALAQAINDNFGSFDEFKNQFTKAASTRFGSGWAWLCLNNDGSLGICSTANQDNPLMPGVGCAGKPILGLDVWEHAYYLHYQNKRPDYIEAFFNIINWNVVSSLFEGA